jgi:hypothetical protein
MLATHAARPTPAQDLAACLRIARGNTALVRSILERRQRQAGERKDWTTYNATLIQLFELGRIENQES